MRFLAAASAIFFFALSASAQDEDAINALIATAGVGGTVTIDQAYTVCGPVTPLQGQTLTGGGSITACTVPRTTLTANAIATDLTIEVADTTGFEVGQSINMGLGGYLSSETSFASHVINDVTPPNITFTNGLGQGYSIGETVWVEFPIVDILVAEVTLDGFTIDGNADAQPAHYGWGGEGRHTIYLGVGAGRGDGVVIQNMTLLNSWGNTIQNSFSKGVSIINNTFDGAYCAAMHVGTTTDSLFAGNIILNSGTQATLCAHSEGALTISANNHRWTVRDNCFDSVGTENDAVIGKLDMLADSNSWFWIYNNRACGFPNFFLAYGANAGGNIVLTNNTVAVTGKFWDWDDPEYPAILHEAGNRTIPAASCSCPRMGSPNPIRWP